MSGLQFFLGGQGAIQYLTYDVTAPQAATLHLPGQPLLKVFVQSYIQHPHDCTRSFCVTL
ncbi:MAG: hypothetical protein ABFE08_16125 [Armatimonadia bacterium]